jgi:hypothetical protein
MPLSSIIDRVISLNTVMGVTKVIKAKQDAVTLILADPIATREAAYVAATKGILDRTTRAMRRVSNNPRQGSFFKLHERYALDLGAKVVKDTDRLLRLEWKAIILLRKKQIADDTAHYSAMLEADRQLGPVWDEFPDRTFQEIEAIYLRRRRSGNGAAAA